MRKIKRSHACDSHLRKHFFAEQKRVPLPKYPYKVQKPHKECAGENGEDTQNYPQNVVFNRALQYAAYAVKYVDAGDAQDNLYN